MQIEPGAHCPSARAKQILESELEVYKSLGPHPHILPVTAELVSGEVSVAIGFELMQGGDFGALIE